MKILLSALACEPEKGSELEVGFQAMLVAAREHDVWVLTNKDTVAAVASAIEGRPEQQRIHLEGIDFGVGADGINRLTIPGFHLHYDRWQRRAASRAGRTRPPGEFRRGASCDARCLLDSRRRGGAGQTAGLGPRGGRGRTSSIAAE